MVPLESGDAGQRLGIVHDTFQHALARDPDILVQHVRIVHISGISGGSGDLTDAQDKQRGLVDHTDRTHTINEMSRLLAAGYSGPFSFECTSPQVQNSDKLAAHQLCASISYLRECLAEPSASER
jgi:2-keto-myo-inositol isomerase